MLRKELFLIILLLSGIGCSSAETIDTVPPAPTTEPIASTSSAEDKAPSSPNCQITLTCQTNQNDTPPPAPKTPTLATDFLENDLGWLEKIRDQDGKTGPYTPGDMIQFGVAEPLATDQSVVRITLPGLPYLGPQDAGSPGFSNEIYTPELLSFGTYRVRAKAAACTPNEEVVTGIFTYSYGADLNGDGIIDEAEESADTNQNGMNDNNEIDIEILCGTPNFIWMTIWTDYTDDKHMQKVTRRVNLSTGKITQTSPGEESTYSTHTTVNESIPGLPVANFDATSDFYEMGFDWQSDHVRYFIVIEDQKITLWNFKSSDQDPTGAKNFIPQNSAHFMLNVWHDNEHWAVSDDPADYPNQDVTLGVDWFEYWAN